MRILLANKACDFREASFIFKRLGTELFRLGPKIQSLIQNRMSRTIQTHIREKPSVSITYFVPDARKSGGEYLRIEGHVRRIDEETQTLYLTDDTRIPLDDIQSLTLLKPE